MNYLNEQWFPIKDIPHPWPDPSSGPWRFHSSPTFGTADTVCFMPSTKVAGCRTRSVWSSTSVLLAFKGPVGLWAPHRVLLWGKLLPVHLWVSWPLGPTCVYFQLFQYPTCKRFRYYPCLCVRHWMRLEFPGRTRTCPPPPTPPPASPAHSGVIPHVSALWPLTQPLQLLTLRQPSWPSLFLPFLYQSSIGPLHYYCICFCRMQWWN